MEKYSILNLNEYLKNNGNSHWKDVSVIFEFDNDSAYILCLLKSSDFEYYFWHTQTYLLSSHIYVKLISYEAISDKPNKAVDGG